MNGSKYRIFKNANNEYLLCKSSTNEGIHYTITDDELSEINSGIMGMNSDGDYIDLLYGKTLEISSGDKDILIKKLFEFSEFKSDEYLELSGNENEIKEFFDIFWEYLR